MYFTRAEVAQAGSGTRRSKGGRVKGKVAMHQGQQRSQQWELPVIGFGHAGAAGHRTAAAGAAMRVGGVQAPQGGLQRLRGRRGV